MALVRWAQLSLTLFETILLDCIVTAVILACILKNFDAISSKLVNFCVAILILVEENKQHYWHITLYYFKKGEDATEMQKIKKEMCPVYGEGAMTD